MPVHEGSSSRPAAPSVAVAAYVVALLVVAGHLAFGANRTNLALGFSVLWLAGLPLLLATQAWARDALRRTRVRGPALLFVIVITVAGLSLTPFDFGGPHPIWSFVPSSLPVTSLNPYGTRVEIVKLTALGAVFLVGALFGADDENGKILIRALLGVGLIFSAWAFIDHVISPSLLFGNPRPFGPDRLSAAFGSGNTAGALFGALVLFNLTDLIRTFESSRSSGGFSIRQLQRLVPRLTRPVLALALAATCLILTLSRAGLIATLGTAVLLVGAMSLARSRKGAISVPLVATGLVLTGLVVASFAVNFDALSDRFTLFGQDSLLRSQIFAVHWAAFQSSPWSGYGLGSFARVNGLIMDRANFDALNTIGAAHNLYIQWLEEIGVPGAVAMLSLMVLVTGKLVLGAVRRRRMRTWLFAVIAVESLLALYGATDYALQTPSMAIFFSLILGTGFGLSSRATESAMALPVATGGSRLHIETSVTRVGSGAAICSS